MENEIAKITIKYEKLLQERLTAAGLSIDSLHDNEELRQAIDLVFKRLKFEIQTFVIYDIIEEFFSLQSEEKDVE